MPERIAAVSDTVDGDTVGFTEFAASLGADCLPPAAIADGED